MTERKKYLLGNKEVLFPIIVHPYSEKENVLDFVTHRESNNQILSNDKLGNSENILCLLMSQYFKTEYL